MSRDTEKEKLNTDYSRREFIKAGALTVGAAAVLSVSGYATAQADVSEIGCSCSKRAIRQGIYELLMLQFAIAHGKSLTCFQNLTTDTKS